MVSLRESVDIPAPFERLQAWAENFEEEFVKWSPYHLECNLYDKSLEAGSRVRFYEIVMGLDYDVSGTIIESEADDKRFRYVFQSDNKAAVIIFAGERTPSGCRFSHTEEFGMQTPVIGPVMNFLIFRVLYKKKANWELIRDDMILDNLYLSRILRDGRYPERMAEEQIRRCTPRDLMKGAAE